jgi:hypothetical protein
MPPPSRNHRPPSGCDTPQAVPASSLESPFAISLQNCRFSAARLTGGLPGDRNGGRPARNAARARPCATTHSLYHEVLRRPLEFAEYTSAAYNALCDRLGVMQSMGRVGSCFDNAAAEAFNSLLKVEYIHRHRFTTRAEARIKIATWITDFYNTRRRHSRADGLPPTEFEQTISQQRAQARQTDQAA